MEFPIWYNQVVPNSFEKKEVPITVKVSASMRQRLEEIAALDDRPLGYVARELMVRGMNLFEADGKVRDVRTEIDAKGGTIAGNPPKIGIRSAGTIKFTRDDDKQGKIKHG